MRMDMGTDRLCECGVSGIILGFWWGGRVLEEQQVWAQEGAFCWAASKRDASERFRRGARDAAGQMGLELG